MTLALKTRADALAPLALLLTVLLAYANAINGPFQFDDWWAIVDNPAVHTLNGWWQALPGIRPLLKLSYALNWQLAPNAAGFHAFNIIVHAGNTLLVFALARRWLPTFAPDGATHGRAAFAVALVFAAHPASTEAVTYISGRSISLMTLFYLAALWAHEKSAPRFWRWLIAPLLFASALGVRETAVTLPFALLLLALCRGGALHSSLHALWPFWLVLLIAVIAAAATPAYGSFFGWSLQTRDLGAQLLGQLEAHRYLLTGPLTGRVLNIDPDVRVPASLDFARLAFLMLSAGIGMLAIQQRRQRPWLLFGLGWYLLHLLPSNSLLPRFDLANDRHLYLSLLGPALWLAIAIGHVPRLMGWTILSVLGTALILATALRNADYRSELALWTATVVTSPHKARPWVNLGWARQQAGDIEGAVTAYQCALLRDPSHPQSQLNLMALGRGDRPLRCPVR